MKKGGEYQIDWAGSIFTAKFIKEDRLSDDTLVYLFTDGNYEYPIRKKNILKKL